MERKHRSKKIKYKRTVKKNKIYGGRDEKQKNNESFVFIVLQTLLDDNDSRKSLSN